MSKEMIDERDEIAKLKAQVADLLKSNAEKDAKVKELEKGASKPMEELCEVEHTFKIQLESPKVEEIDKKSQVDLEKIELEGIETIAHVAFVTNGRGEQQLELWADFACDEAFYLTVFTQVSLSQQQPAPGAANAALPALFGRRSELMRVGPGNNGQCAKIIVPDWHKTYANTYRGKPVPLEFSVKIVRTFSENRSVIEEDEDSLRKIEVQGKKYFVNHSYLCAWSLDFLDIEEITEISPTDFEEMLNVIYPTSKPISAWNVERMLKAANQFRMPELTRKCEIFLNEIGPHNLSEMELLLLADEYSLYSIKTIVLERITSTAEMRAKILSKTDQLHQLSPEMRKAISSSYTEMHQREVK